MKYIKNVLIVSVMALTIVFVGCDAIDDSRFGVNPEQGWVEFTSAGETINAATTSVSAPVLINVPVFKDGIEISYELVPVQGDFSAIVGEVGTSIFESPVGSNRRATIDFDISGVADLTEQVIFDVVLTSTSIDGVSVGVGEESITSYRISTPCPLDYTALAGTYTVAEVFTAGLNEGLSLAAAFGESYQMEIALDAGDITQSQVILSNSAGFDQFIADGTVMTFDTCNGVVSFSESPLNLALFADMAIETSVYSENPPVITVDGTLGNFGPYQFVLTKQ